MAVIVLEIIAENVFQGRNVSIEFAKNSSRQDRNPLFMGVKNSSGNNWYITKIEMMVMSSLLPNDVVTLPRHWIEAGD